MAAGRKERGRADGARGPGDAGTGDAAGTGAPGGTSGHGQEDPDGTSGLFHPAVEPHGEAPHPRVALIWAEAKGGVIGANGQMPWHLPEDLARFKELTYGRTVLMGRATWESLPPGFRPLPGRRCLVLSRTPGLELPGAEVLGSIEAALAAAAVHCPGPGGQDEGAQLWVIGGARVYAQLLPCASRLAVTRIDLEVDGDAHAPAIGPQWRLEASSGWLTSRTKLRYCFEDYVRA